MARFFEKKYALHRPARSAPLEKGEEDYFSKTSERSGSERATFPDSNAI